MLLTAARSRPHLTDEAVERMERFVISCLGADGGFAGPGGKSDLYYTVFGIECLLALGKPIPNKKLAGYLAGFREGEGLDFVHLACFVRCIVRLATPGAKADASKNAGRVCRRIERHRCRDGGYGAFPGAAQSTAYATFLAFLVYEDAGLPMPRISRVIASLDALRRADGGYANECSLESAATTATAAAVVLLSRLGGKISGRTVGWLVGRHQPGGGFLAFEGAPAPDLVSTATALFALRTAGAPMEQIRRPCLEFVESLWAESGGFCGCAAEHTPDCEYTFYGLLALGCLL